MAPVVPYYTDPTTCYSWQFYTYSTYDPNLTGVSRCPNCGRWHETSTIIYANYPPAPPPDPEPVRSVKEALKEWHRALSRHAAWEAMVALRSAPDDPGHRVPLPARQRPYVRQRAKKRVCAGSSRYRVLVN